MKDFVFTALIVFSLISSVPVTFATCDSNEGLTQTYLVNGGQTILADPVRPLVYQLDQLTGELRFIDSTTSAVLETLDMGQDPSSIAISHDLALLYVAVSGDNRVSVVDIELALVLRNISLEFAPFSVTVGRPDRLYVSCVEDYSWRVVNEESGVVLSTITEAHSAVLEASPDGDDLIAITCGITPTKVNLYDVRTDDPHLKASDDHDLGGSFKQHAADWLNDTLYLANGGPYGLEVVSLTDLSRVGFLPASAYPSGVALSLDKSLAYCLCSNPYESIIYVFDIASMTSLGAGKTLPGDRYYLVTTGDGDALFVADPLTRIRIEPSLEPSAPADGAVYAYTPSFVEALLTEGLPVVELYMTWMKVDDIDADVVRLEDGRLQGLTVWYMDNGTHTVNASVLWMDRVIWSNWSFEIDRGDPDAVRPELLPGTPEPDSIMTYPGGEVTATLVDPYPSPLYEYAGFVVGGVVMDAFIYDGSVRTTDEIGLLEPGVISVRAYVYYDYMTMNSSTTWNFTLDKYQITMPEIVPVSPAPDSYIFGSPDYIEFDLRFGEPAVVIEWLNASLDDTALDTNLSDDDTVRADVEWEVPTGGHIVIVELVWDMGTISVEWGFYVDNPWALSVYESDAGFQIPLPVGWARTENQNESDGSTEVEVRGPVIDGVTTTIMLETARDATVRESTEYMDDQIQIAVDELDAEGIATSVDWTFYEEIGGHFGVTFLMVLDVEPVVILTSVVVSEEHERFWIIMMVFSSGIYEKANSTFSEMVAGFEITLSPSPDVERSFLLAVAAGLVGGVAVLVGVFIYMSRRGRPGKAPQGPAGQPAAAPTTGFCSACGAPQPLTNLTCGACGRPLRVPPFGAAGNDRPPRTGA